MIIATSSAMHRVDWGFSSNFLVAGAMNPKVSANVILVSPAFRVPVVLLFVLQTLTSVLRLPKLWKRCSDKPLETLITFKLPRDETNESKGFGQCHACESCIQSPSRAAFRYADFDKFLDCPSSKSVVPTNQAVISVKFPADVEFKADKVPGLPSSRFPDSSYFALRVALKEDSHLTVYGFGLRGRGRGGGDRGVVRGKLRHREVSCTQACSLYRYRYPYCDLHTATSKNRVSRIGPS